MCVAWKIHLGRTDGIILPLQIHKSIAFMYVMRSNWRFTVVCVIIAARCFVKMYAVNDSAYVQEALSVHVPFVRILYVNLGILSKTLNLSWLKNAKQRHTGILIVHGTLKKQNSYWGHKTKRGIAILSRYTSFWQNLYGGFSTNLRYIERKFSVCKTEFFGKYRFVCLVCLSAYPLRTQA